MATWRPTGSAVLDRLRRFFVGGATKLSDITYISRPSDSEVRTVVFSYIYIHFGELVVKINNCQ